MFGNLSINNAAIFLIVVAIFYLLDLALVMLDLRAGVRKAKKAGIYKSSKKLRRTVEKLDQYYNLLLMFSLVDAIIVVAISLLQLRFPHFPFLTFGASIGVGYIEIKSVFEKAEDKEKANIQEAAEELAKLSRNRDLSEVLTSMAAFLEQNRQKAEEGR